MTTETYTLNGQTDFEFNHPVRLGTELTVEVVPGGVVSPASYEVIGAGPGATGVTVRYPTAPTDGTKTLKVTRQVELQRLSDFTGAAGINATGLEKEFNNIYRALRDLVLRQTLKAPVKVATASNITLSGEQTVNGVSVTDGDRVLVTSQTDDTENGIYNVSTAAWTRTPDADDAEDIVNGTIVLDENSGDVWRFQFSGDFDPGTTSITMTSSRLTDTIIGTGDAGKIPAVNTAETAYELKDEAGVVEYLRATQAEAEAGSINNRVMTPERTQQVLDPRVQAAETQALRQVQFSNLFTKLVRRQSLDGNIESMAFCGDRFVAGTLTGSASGSIWTSDDDGDTWTDRQSLDGSVEEIICVSGLLIACTFSSANTSGSVWTSSDNGETWTNQQTFTPGIRSLGYGDGTYVIGLDNGDIWTSSDNGETWTQRQTLTGAVTGVDYGNGVYVAVTGGNLAYTSTDAQTWSQSFDFTEGATDLSFADGIFVAGDAVASVWTSTDGQSWTDQQTLDGNIQAQSYGGGVYTVGTTAGSIWASIDGGESWENLYTLSSNVEGAAYGKGVFMFGTRTENDVFTPLRPPESF